MIRCILPDGSRNAVTVGEHDSASAVVKKLCEKLEISNPSVFALYASRRSLEGVGQKPGRVVRPEMPLLATVLAAIESSDATESVHFRQRFFLESDIDCSRS